MFQDAFADCFAASPNLFDDLQLDAIALGLIGHVALMGVYSPAGSLAYVKYLAVSGIGKAINVKSHLLMSAFAICLDLRGALAGSFMPLLAVLYSSTLTPWLSSLALLALK